MSRVAIVDSNLLLLLIVGTTDRRYIASHRRLTDFAVEDFDLLVNILGTFSEVVLVPHVCAEVSNLVGYVADPAKRRIRLTLRQLIETSFESAVASRDGVSHAEYENLGLTDAVLLHVCSLADSGLLCTLLTADGPLYNRANASGLDAILYADLLRAR